MDISVESCGLGDWHQGQLPDERMQKAAKYRGLTLTSRARGFRSEFFDNFDYILCADNKVLFELHRFAKIPEHKEKIHLITSFSTVFKDQEVPDPYYGGEGHFDLVLDMLEESCQSLLDHLSEEKK